MFDSYIEALTDISIMIDGVPYAPVLEVIEETIPMIVGIGFAFGVCVSVGAAFIDGLFLLIKLLIRRFRSRKTTEQST